MREEGTRYKKFWLTLKMVATEEGYRGLYRGLTTQLIKQHSQHGYRHIDLRGRYLSVL